MLQIVVPKQEGFNSKTNEFITFPGQTLQLEHSLVSLDKWESKWHKPFLTKDTKPWDEQLDYIRCMTITQNVHPDTYLYLTDKNKKAIKEYIEDPMTATTFYGHDNQRGGRKEQITSELIYYWMVAFNIPFECKKWHLNKLLTLIRICSIKNEPPKKMSQAEVMRRNAALNAQRKARLGTRG